MMEKIDATVIQQYIDTHANKDVYLHLETTNGAYANHHEKKFASGAFIRNAKVRYVHGKIISTNHYRVGLETEIGWIYAEGLTHYEIDEAGRLLMAGIDYDGKLAVACELSDQPFPK